MLSHAERASLPLGRLTVLSIAEPGRDALADPAEVLGWAQAATDQLRALADERWPRLHVFLYGPRTAAVLLRTLLETGCRPLSSGTTSAGRGYTPAFTLPAT